MKFGILGAGSFGSAIARHIVTMGTGAGEGEPRHEAVLWCRRPEQAEAIERSRENPDYLKGIAFPGNLRATADMREALDGTDRVVLAVPAQSVRSLLTSLADVRPGGRGLHLVNLAKGIEVATGSLLHRVAGELLPEATYCALSGPSHAEEVGRGMPTALVAASERSETAMMWQECLNDERLRIYTSGDVPGVEIGGAMKNVIAIAVGVARSVGFGDNSVASLVTRGLAEIMRYGAHAGTNPLTLAGLAGMGDLIATCYSMHSRNLRFGMLVGEGHTPETAAGEIGQVVEGMSTARALVARARGEGVELPLSEGVYRVLYENVPLRAVMTELLFREPKAELGGPR